MSQSRLFTDDHSQVWRVAIARVCASLATCDRSVVDLPPSTGSMITTVSFAHLCKLPRNVWKKNVWNTIVLVHCWTTEVGVDTALSVTPIPVGPIRLWWMQHIRGCIHVSTVLQSFTLSHNVVTQLVTQTQLNVGMAGGGGSFP
jgi:hypothetical protein